MPKRRFRRIPQKTIDAANEYVRMALRHEGRVEVKVPVKGGWHTVLSAPIFALLWQSLMRQDEIGAVLAPFAWKEMKVFIDGKEIARPPYYDELEAQPWKDS